jgi:death-on-curing protein
MDVVAINRQLLAGTPEPHLLVAPDLLESACEKPHNHWAYGGVDDVVSLATILLFGIAFNHAFIQGNKRTAFAAMTFFLEDNGLRLALDDDPRCADDLIAALQQRITLKAFEDKLRRVVAPLGQHPWP